MSGPEAFVQGQGGGYRPPQVAPSATEDARAVYAPAPPLLTLAWPNRCTLSKPLLAAVPHLKLGCRVLLVVPTQRGGKWFLNTRPAPEMGSVLPGSGAAVFRVAPVARMHFMQPRPVLAGPGGRAGMAAVGNENVLATSLHFRLGTEVPGHPGLYELIRELSTGS